MATKRPQNGIDLSYRRSHMKSQHNKWNAHLAQGTKEMEKKKQLQLESDRIEQEKKALKQQMKQEAQKLDIELGFAVPINETEQRNSMPEWKKQKMFIKQTFPGVVVSRRYKNQFVFKNKQSMQEYHRAVLPEEDWENNLILLAEMRAAYDEALESAAALDVNLKETTDSTKNDDKSNDSNVVISKQTPLTSSEDITADITDDTKDATKEVNLESSDDDETSNMNCNNKNNCDDDIVTAQQQLEIGCVVTDISNSSEGIESVFAAKIGELTKKLDDVVL